MASALTAEQINSINNASEEDIIETLTAHQGRNNAISKEVVILANQRLDQIAENKGVRTSGDSTNPVIKFATDLATAANQGITFGFGDELTGLLGAVGTMGSDTPFSQRYAQFRDASRQDLANMNPVLRTGAEFAGGMLTGGGAAKAGGMLLGQANKQIPQVARGQFEKIAPTQLAPQTRQQALVTGGGAGVVAGAGGSEAPIMSERFGQDMAVGGLLGSGLGGAVFTTPEQRSAIAMQARSLLTPSNPQERARRVVRKRIAEDTTPVETMANRVGSMQAGTMMDVSPSARALGEDIVTEGGRPGQRLTDFVQDRLGRSLRRVNRTLSNIVGNPKAYYQSREKLEDQMAKDAAPLYDEYRKMGITVTPQLKNILDRIKLYRGGILQKARSNAYAAGDLEVPQSMSKVDADADDAKELPPIDATVLDYAKRRMDDLIAGFIKNERGDEARSLGILRKDLIDEIDKQTDNAYKAARDAYAGPAANKAALEAGRKFMRLDSEEVEFVLRDFETDMEREMFRLGAARAISDKIGKRTTTQSVAKDLRAPVFKERLKELFPNQPGAYDRLVKVFDDEDEMFQTFSSLMTNSRTARRQAGQDRLSRQIAEAAGESLLTGDAGLTRRILQRIGQRAGLSAQQRFARLSDEVKNQIATILTSGSPAQQAEVLRTLQNPSAVRLQPSMFPGLLNNQGAMPAAAGIQGGLLFSDDQ